MCIHVHVCMHTDKKTCTHIDTHIHTRVMNMTQPPRGRMREVCDMRCVLTLLPQILGPGSRVSVVSLAK